jgi:hypothetical protein
MVKNINIQLDLPWRRIFCLALTNAIISASALASPVNGKPLPESDLQCRNKTQL